MIHKRPLLIETAIVAIIVAILHILALEFFLYWSIPTFDILMHFLGGLVIGLFVLFIFFTSGYIKYPQSEKIVVFSVTLGAVLIVGLTWELWELFVGFTDILTDQADTTLDVIMDLLGGVVAYSYGIKKIWQRK